jgi:hypothetical protein
MSDPTKPGDGAGGGDVISLDEARAKAQEGEPGAAPPDGATMTVNGAEFLKPVMAAIARELAGVTDSDGQIRIGGADEASRAKTAAVVKGLGQGLGQALAEAFGKWAQKIQTGQVPPPVTGTATVTPAAATTETVPPPDDKKPS